MSDQKIISEAVKVYEADRVAFYVATWGPDNATLDSEVRQAQWQAFITHQIVSQLSGLRAAIAALSAPAAKLRM